MRRKWAVGFEAGNGASRSDRGSNPPQPTQSLNAQASGLDPEGLHTLGHDDAVRVLTAVRESESFTILSVGRSTFEAAVGQFGDYVDQAISFVDHTTATLADERDAGHVFAFDSDFRTLGFFLVPEDVDVT